MIKGGIYIYPTSSKAQKENYVCCMNAINGFYCRAGGKASDGFGRIMEIQPTELHERVPFFCGSYNMVEKSRRVYVQSETK
jgi:fructose-1,6-bisphosphatase I